MGNLREEEFPTWLVPPPPPPTPSTSYQLWTDNGQSPNFSGMSLFPWLISMTLLSNLQGQNQNRLQEAFRWRQVDLAFPTIESRVTAIASGTFIPANNLPLGLEVWDNRIFISLPKWKRGIPATLVTIPRDSKGNASPLMTPYPNWNWHVQYNCDGLTSVFRMSIDPCGRLWVLDSGAVDIATNMKQKCPPQILIFDLKTDNLLWRYRLPDEQVKEGSLYTNIVVDVRHGRCEDAFAYLADVFRYGLVVYSWREDRSWRISHSYFYPDPLASEYSIHGSSFRWTDGIFALALSPEENYKERYLYFHPLSSYREFSVPTSVLKNETAADSNPEKFRVLEEERGPFKGHSAGSAIDRRGIMFYNLVSEDAVGCWNSNQPQGYLSALQGIVARDNISLIFPNDLKVDQDKRQNVWILSNRLQQYFYKSLNPNDFNFRILTAPTDIIVKGTVCDPEYVHIPITNRIKCDI